MNAPPGRDLWRRVEPILERALALEPQVREVYLAEACAGDATLRREVENLLEADREAESFLSGAVGDVAGSLFHELDPTLGEPPVELSEGRVLGRYRIVRRLGGGGMGEVYEVEDPRLGRRVALKVLPRDTAGDGERLRRFEREARAVATLNHPNIVTIHSVEQSDGVPLLTMELVEGRTLDGAIPEDGMSLDAFLDLALPLADALATAHETGITHRDLKPANIMVTGEGRLKILDFGLAKLQTQDKATGVSPAETVAMTREGVILGTVPYMSPEQAEGRPVDSRTDVFSLGVIFYEMLTGERPFRGDTPAALISSILRDVPRPLTDFRTDLPATLEELIRGCLEKAPDRRALSAREVRDGLDRLRHQSEAERFLADSGVATPPEGRRRRRLVATAAGAVLIAAFGAVFWQMERPSELAAPGVASPVGERESERKKIAVLPFDNLGRAEDEHFAAGMTEEITARLAAVHDLGVISRKSAQFYSGTDKAIAQIGEELGVDYVLEGTVRWEHPADGPSRIRITPQLIRVADDTHLWAEVYERDVAGIFALQSEIAERVVEELGVTLATSAREAIEARPTENLEAYQAYLRGRTLHERVQGATRDKRLAVESFERAVELDPDFAGAHAELSRAHSWRYASTMDAAAGEAARRTLERALELAPELPEVQLAQAYYYVRVLQDYDRALEVLSRIESVRPNNAEALEARGDILRKQGRWEEALALFERAAELSPRDLWLQGHLAIFTLAPLRRYSEAMEVCNRAIVLGPDQRLLYDTKAAIYWLWKGTTEEARIALETLPAEGPFSRMMELYQEIYERDYRAALERASAMGSDWVEGHALGRWPKSLLEAMVYELLQEPGLAERAYATALALAEDELRLRPHDPEIHSVLGYVYAGLGRKEEAIQAGKRAVELLPTTRNAMGGPMYLRHLAAIYTRVGEHEAAFDELDRLLSLPFYHISVPLLELEPWWDPLRDHPRYRELVGRHRPDTDPNQA